MRPAKTVFALVALVSIAQLAPAADSQALLKTFRDEFVHVTPGKNGFPAEFLMGRESGGDDSQRPVRRVVLKHDFHVARYEVPQNLWEAVMGGNPSRWKGARNSVEMLTYDEAVRFCQRATTLMREAKLIEPKQVIRLPSEAEWEYFARAGTTTLYSFGDDPKELGDYAWFTGNAAGNDPPVGAKKPNPWKLYDIHGYLWEWCADPWHDDFKGAPSDASVWQNDGDSKHAVLRGGSWKDPAEKLTTSHRRKAEKSLKDDAVGLRCVLQ
jgi:formylglycine-generating enzyme required for sulfatase activity